MRDRLEALGLPGIVDVHTHFMPQRLLDKVWAYFDRAGPLIATEWPITYRVPEEERVATLRGFGVERFSSLCYAHKPGMARWLNDWCADFAARHPDCLHSATFYPEPDVTSYVDEALAGGARIFKTHVQVGDFDPNDPQLDAVWGRLEESRTPVVTHIGHGPAAGTHTGHEGAAEVLRRFPDLTMVVAHLGMPDYGEFIDLCAAYPRVHLDTTMAFTWFAERSAPFPEERRADLLALGDRILFGSDFPNIPYTYDEAVDAVIRLGLGDEWVRGVLRDNAARLFGLD